MTDTTTTDRPDDHERQVALLLRAHRDWMQKNVPHTLGPLAVFESYLKAAATVCIGMGLDLDQTAGLMEDFAAALRLRPGEADPTRATTH
jgi:hypothetical protein